VASKSLIEALLAEHDLIVNGIEKLSAAAKTARIDGDLLRHLLRAIREHYLLEEQLLELLHEHEPKVAAKLVAQHEEALEIAGRIEESQATGESADLLYLLRRFLAIAEHNIIEEERDVFPLARRCIASANDER
jgi:DNA-binding transcriptional MocR family regulator